MLRNDYGEPANCEFIRSHVRTCGCAARMLQHLGWIPLCQWVAIPSVSHKGSIAAVFHGFLYIPLFLFHVPLHCYYTRWLPLMTGELLLHFSVRAAAMLFDYSFAHSKNNCVCSTVLGVK